MYGRRIFFLFPAASLRILRTVVRRCRSVRVNERATGNFMEIFQLFDLTWSRFPASPPTWHFCTPSNAGEQFSEPTELRQTLIIFSLNHNILYSSPALFAASFGSCQNKCLLYSSGTSRLFTISVIEACTFFLHSIRIFPITALLPPAR